MTKEIYEEYNFRGVSYKVLKQVHPDTNITLRANNELNLLLHNVIERIMTTANRLRLGNEHDKTTSSREIQSAIRLVLPGELAKHAVSEGTKAVTKFTSSKFGDKVKGVKISRSKRSGLQFPVGRIENLIRLYNQSKNTRVGSGAPVYLAGVIEYLAAEILELSGNAARDHKHTRITTRDITLAIYNDTELSHLFKEVTLSGGVLPHIHAVLLPKIKEKKTKKTIPSKKKTSSKKKASSKKK